MRHFHIVFLCFCMLNSACTTTRVTDVRYERGNLLKHETSPEILDRTEYELAIDRDSTRLNEKHIYVAKEIKIYEKIKSTNLKTDGTTMTDSPFWAIIGTPGALFLDVISLGTMGATAEIWTKDSNQWKTIKDKLSDDFFVDEKNVYSNKRVPIPDANIQLKVNGKTAQTTRTDANGKAEYSFVDVLISSTIEPEQLIRNQGVTLTATFAGTNKAQKFANKDIPDAYFARKFNDMRDVLSKRAGRFGNCEFIANSKREFFECYYE